MTAPLPDPNPHLIRPHGVGGMIAAFGPDSGNDLDSVRSLLRGQVAGVLGGHLPGLATIPKNQIYDRVMEDPRLLSQAFQLLRQKPDLFAEVLRTPQNTLPHSDQTPLICGRNLGEIVTLVLRASARRYFRKTHQVARLPKRRPVQKTGLWNEFLSIWGWAPAPQNVRGRRITRTNPGDELYHNMRPFLLFDWQAPLIPTYAKLSVGQVKTMGMNLLDYREPQSLQQLVIEDRGLIGGKATLLTGPAQKLLTNGTDSLNADVLWQAYQDMKLATLFKGFDGTEIRRAIAVIAASDPKAIRTLMPALGPSAHHFALFLFVAYANWGPIRYRQAFGTGCPHWTAQALAQRIAANGKLTGSQEEIKARMEGWLDGALAEVKG